MTKVGMKMSREESDCAVSLIVIAHNMARELPRTLASLAPPIQRDVDQIDYEVIVVDNGSTQQLDLNALPAQVVKRLRYHRIENASPSPVNAV
ncbi:MAG: glycosyltransferase, partial [Pseudomonadota bacterium]